MVSNCSVIITKLIDVFSVHELTPYDIKIVAALGDSVTVRALQLTVQ